MFFDRVRFEPLCLYSSDKEVQGNLQLCKAYNDQSHVVRLGLSRIYPCPGIELEITKRIQLAILPGPSRRLSR